METPEAARLSVLLGLTESHHAPIHEASLVEAPPPTLQPVKRRGPKLAPPINQPEYASKLLKMKELYAQKLSDEISHAEWLEFADIAGYLYKKGFKVSAISRTTGIDDSVLSGLVRASIGWSAAVRKFVLAGEVSVNQIAKDSNRNFPENPKLRGGRSGKKRRGKSALAKKERPSILVHWQNLIDPKLKMMPGELETERCERLKETISEERERRFKIEKNFEEYKETVEKVDVGKLIRENSILKSQVNALEALRANQEPIKFANDSNVSYMEDQCRDIYKIRVYVLGQTIQFQCNGDREVMSGVLLRLMRLNNGKDVLLPGPNVFDAKIFTRHGMLVMSFNSQRQRDLALEKLVYGSSQ